MNWVTHEHYQEIERGQTRITLEPAYGQPNKWIAKIFPGADGWPKYFSDYARARDEIEAWLQNERPGKYDELATSARLSADADAVILLVFGGSKGNGLSVQYKPSVIDLKKRVPHILRHVAQLIEEEESS